MFGLTTTRRLRAELAAERAETTRQRERAELAEQTAVTAVFNRGQILRQNTDLVAEIRRLRDRNLELGERLGKSTPEYTVRLEARIRRLLKVRTRFYAAGHAEWLRANHLQRRLDQALGLDSPAIEQAGARAKHDRLNRQKETA